MEHWSGIARHEILGMDIRQRFPQLTNMKYKRRLEQVFMRGLPAVFSSHLHKHIIPCQLPSGSLRVQHTTVTPLKNPNELGFYALFSIQDITDLTKQALKYQHMRDRALREAEERARVEATVRMLNEELEHRVAERTLQVQEMNEELTREIAEKKQAEQALHESEQLLSLIFDTVNVGLSVVNEQGEYVRVNQAYARIIGYESPTELIGLPFTVMYPPQEHAESIERLSELLGNSMMEEIMGERVVTTKKLDRVDIFFTTTKFATEQNAKFAITAITDVSILKRAENEIRASLQKEKELNELKSHFVSLVSHEFRTPMTIILSSSELLQNAVNLSEEKRKNFFSRIESSIQRMTELLEDVLFIERSGTEGIAFRPHNVELAELCAQIIDEACTAFAANRGAERTVNFIFHDPLSACKTPYLDEQLIRYILLNLLLNAFKYSPIDTDIVFDVICTDTHIAFRVQDKGIGIPEEDLPKIFDLFHRGKNTGLAPGTGLGLAIVKRSVDAHGGLIECQSEVGSGTTFTVQIPRMSAPVSA